MRVNIKTLDRLYFLAFLIILGSCIFPLSGDSVLSGMLSLGSKLAFCIALPTFLLYCKRNSEKPFCLLDGLILLIFLIMEYANTFSHSTIQLVWPYLMRIFTLRWLLQMSVDNSKFAGFKGINSLFYLLIVLNLIFLIFAPGLFGSDEDGRQVYLIAHNYNQFGGLMVPAILIMYLYDKITNKSMWGLLIICFLTGAITGSMTTTANMLLLLITYYYRNNIKFTRLIKLGLLIGIPLFLFIYVIPFLAFNLNTLLESLTSSMGKEMTFSYRTVIWAQTLLVIAYIPIYGVGMYDGDFGHEHIIAVNPHNIILDCWLSSGLIGLTITIVIYFLIVRQIQSIRNYKERNIVSIIALVYLFMSMFEVYLNVTYYFFLYLLYFSPVLLNKVKFKTFRSVKRQNKFRDGTFGVNHTLTSL